MNKLPNIRWITFWVQTFPSTSHPSSGFPQSTLWPSAPPPTCPAWGEPDPFACCSQSQESSRHIRSEWGKDYSKGLEEPSVPVSHLVEVEISAVRSVKSGNSLAFVSDAPLEEIRRSIWYCIYLFLTLPKVIYALSSFFLSWKTIDSVASDLRLPMKTPE